jgi:hypothetical protein
LGGFTQSPGRLTLYAVPGKERFYEAFGFRHMLTAMAIFENLDKAFARGDLERP